MTKLDWEEAKVKDLMQKNAVVKSPGFGPSGLPATFPQVDYAHALTGLPKERLRKMRRMECSDLISRALEQQEEGAAKRREAGSTHKIL